MWACAARYRIETHRNWEGVGSSKIGGNQSDQAAVLTFDKLNLRKMAANSSSRPKFVVGDKGREGLTGSLTPGSGITWTTTIKLGSREEILRQYRQMHPPEIDGLQKWLQVAVTRDAGIKSITIACFAPSDPVVYYHVDRPAKGPVVMAVFWNKELQAWVVASSLERSQGPEKFEEMHRIISSVACSTLTFE